MGQYTLSVARHAVVAREVESLWNEPAGERATIRVSGTEAGGAFSIAEGIVGLMSAPPLHAHANDGEVILIAEGVLRFAVVDETVDAPAGTILVMPRHTAYLAQPVGDTGVRLRVLHTRRDRADVRAVPRSARRGADDPRGALCTIFTGASIRA